MNFERGKGYRMCPVDGEIFEHDTFGATGPSEYMCNKHRTILVDIKNPMEDKDESDCD